MTYPFSPEVLDAMPERLAELYRSLDVTLLNRIAERIKTGMPLGEATLQDIRALRAQGLSEAEIKRLIQTVAGVGERQLNALLDDVVARNQAYYSDVIDLARITAPEALVDAAVIDAIRRQTMGAYRNLTRSMGYYVAGQLVEPGKAYQWALDNAMVQVQSSAISYSQAIANATRQLADSGLSVVQYESGHVDKVDVAVRRAVLTGIAQINEQYNAQAMEYLQTDLVEVSAHAGARNTGVGFQNHEAWQGKIYRWRQYTQEFPNASHGRYADFVETCGLGDVQGIYGANCRHSHVPFVEGVMEPTYSEADLEGLKAKPFEYEGQKYDTYTATQKQREIERAIRRQKRRLAAAVNDKDELAIKARIRALNEKYAEFSKAAGLRMQKERANVYIP